MSVLKSDLKWWQRTRKGQLGIQAGGGLPPCVEVFVPWWGNPFEFASRAVRWLFGEGLYEDPVERAWAKRGPRMVAIRFEHEDGTVRTLHGKAADDWWHDLHGAVCGRKQDWSRHKFTIIKDNPPVRLCCGQRHFGPVCPDGQVMCELCFERFPMSHLNTLESGERENVCRECAKAER